MNGGLLWVNKDSKSTHLSRSSKAETARIRAHVQHLSIQSRARKRPTLNQKVVKKGKRQWSSEDDNNVSELASPSLSSAPPVQFIDHTSDHQGDFGAGTVPLTKSLPWLPNASDNEKRSFLFFLNRTADEWSGYADGSFWNDRVPLVSATYPSIFHSVAALGALHESMEIDQHMERAGHLQQLIWQQCSKAVTASNSNNISHTVALMSCIIIICLQNLQSNPAAFQMLRVSSNLVRDLEHRIANGDISLSSSDSELLENYLKPILERLETRYCFIADLPSSFALHVAARNTQLLVKTPAPALPSSFETLLQARNSLQSIASWCVINVTASDHQNDVYCSNKELAESLLMQWTDLLQSMQDPTDEQPSNFSVSRLLLKASSLLTRILFDTLGTSQECVYDRHLQKFKEIVRIYERASKFSSAARRRKVSFGIDSGSIHTLAFVIGRCRDPKVRREALALLERDDHIEGDMRASTGLNIVRKLVELEEEGKIVTRQEDVPESDRLRIWEDQQFWHSGLLKIWYIKAPYDPRKGAPFLELRSEMPIRIRKDETTFSTPSQSSGSDTCPNVVFARGLAMFLDEHTGVYHKVSLSSFFVPMPRI